MKELYEKLDKLEDEIFEIVSNRGTFDELDFIKNDINTDWELGVIEDMDFNDLEKYVNNVENILMEYKEVH